jgi:hypothetical protein
MVVVMMNAVPRHPTSMSANSTANMPGRRLRFVIHSSSIMSLA